MRPKPFKTVDEQIELLERRGVVFDDKERAARFLLREGYYVVVNGYKDAFIDKEATNLTGDDVFKRGLPFTYFELVYRFDTALRRRTMDVLINAENAMKTATVYAFCSVHEGADDYLDPANYCRKSDYKPQENYTRGLIKLLSSLQAIRDNKHRKAYIEHYAKDYHCVPLWVASKCMTFGNMSAFFDFQQQNVKTRACVALARALGKETVRQKDLTYAYHTLPEFRNICAHDERLYCTKVGKNGDKGFKELLRALKAVTAEGEFSKYVSDVIGLVDIAGEGDLVFKSDLLAGLGVSYEELKTMIEE